MSKAGLAYAIGFKLVFLESARSLEYKVIRRVVPISEDVSKFQKYSAMLWIVESADEGIKQG